MKAMHRTNKGLAGTPKTLICNINTVIAVIKSNQSRININEIFGSETHFCAHFGNVAIRQKKTTLSYLVFQDHK